jgi:hypothetical protein
MDSPAFGSKIYHAETRRRGENAMAEISLVAVVDLKPEGGHCGCIEQEMGGH